MGSIYNNECDLKNNIEIQRNICYNNISIPKLNIKNIYQRRTLYLITLKFWGKLETFADLAQALHGALDNVLLDAQITGEDMIFTLNDNSTVIMHIPSTVQTPEDFQIIQHEFMLYLSLIKTDKVDVKIELLQHFATFNTMLEIKFESTNNEDRLEHMLVCSVKATGVLDGVLVLPNLNILDGNGDMIFNNEGKSDFEFYIPLNQENLTNTQINEEIELSKEDKARYNMSTKILKSKDIIYSSQPLIFILRTIDCNRRSIQDICKRIISLYATGIYTQNMLKFSPNREEVLLKLHKINEKFDFLEYATDDELDYLNNDNFKTTDGLKFSLDFECIAVLLWSLGLYENLGDPVEKCNKEEIITILEFYQDIEELITYSTPLSIEELLQEHDIIMRYHWACEQRRTYNQYFSYPLDEDIVLMRHKTLNWILTTIYGDEWDTIQTFV